MNNVVRKDPAISFDTTASDPIAVEYRRVREILRTTIADDKTLKGLDAKADQIRYEDRLSYLVTEAIRDTIFSPQRYRQAKNDLTSRNLNQLTDKSEYDCEHLTYIRGMLIHEGDQYAVRLGQRSHATQFYAVTGGYIFDRENEKELLTAHMFIASAASGNVIEATNNTGKEYRVTDKSFDEIIAGHPLLVGKHIYTSSFYNLDMKVVAERLAFIQQTPEHLDTLGIMQQHFYNTANPFTPGSAASKWWDTQQFAGWQLAAEDKCSSRMDITTTEGAPLTTTFGHALNADTSRVDRSCTSDAALQNQIVNATNAVKSLLLGKLLTFTDISKEAAPTVQPPGITPAQYMNPHAILER